MSTQVISSLKKNMIGVVIDGYTTQVLDSGDLVGKADTAYVNKVQTNLSKSIEQEKGERNSLINTVKGSVELLKGSLATKADKDAVQKILTELALTRIRADLETILAQHIANIHEVCVKERGLIGKEIAAFKEAATSAGEETGRKLQPVYDQFQALGNQIKAVAGTLAAIQPLQERIRGLEAGIHSLELQTTQVGGMVEMNRTLLEKIVSEQLKGFMPQIIRDVEKERKKKRNFFSRLFSG